MKKLIIALIIGCNACFLYAASMPKTLHIQRFGESDGFSEALVSCIIQDSLGYIWLATWDGLRCYDGYRFQTFKAQPGDNCPLETNRISYIKEDADHNIICWSNDKFYLFNRRTRQFEPYQGNDFRITLYKAPDMVRQLITKVEGFDNIEINILLVDRQEGVWTYSHRGLERISLTPKPVQAQKHNTQGEEVVYALYSDRKKRLWCADKGGYIHISTDDGQTLWLNSDGRLTRERAKFGYATYHILEDSKGAMWIGTKPGGLFHLVPSEGKYKVEHFRHDPRDPYSINCEAVYDIAEDDAHRIIIATYGGGMNIAEPQGDGSMRFIHCGNLLKTFPKAGMRSRCVHIMPDGTALLGTNDGLYTVSLHDPYPKMHFFVNSRQPGRATSISSNFVMEILRTRNGELYIATSGGGTERILSKQLLSDSISFQHYSVKEGISSDMNQTITEDNDGNVWIVSFGSLSLLNPKTGVASNYWRLLSGVGEMFTESTPALLTDGSMVLGTTMGTLTLHPQSMAKSSFVPRIVFDCDKSVNLSPDEKDFSISFAALDYNKNEEIIYAYRMEGIDSEWHYTRHNELNYVSLAPGTYTLRIKSTNGDGVWVDNEETIVIHRSARFSETPYSWMLYGLLLAAFLFAVWATLRYIRMLKRELKDVKLTSKEQIEVLGARIKELLPISESVREIHEESNRLSGDDKLFAQKLKAYVENNISNPDLSVIDLAQAMNVSRTVLFVRMKHIFDSSPNNYVLNTRINFAKKLLMQTGIRVSDVAFQCGFSDPKYFSRCFKKLVGMLPKEYADSIKISEKRG
ncbi:MAG: helix-turn-helix domain-containing protein [Prevotella sp.]|nr:helix-turn-helix domain-containing protein [Prevotella sp.]